MRLPRPLLPLAAAALCVASLATLAACGSGSGGETNSAQAVARIKSQRIVEREQKQALATGRSQCRLLKDSLPKSYHTNSLAKAARRYSRQIYIGNFPNLAAKGCLEALRAGPSGSAG